MLDTYPELIRAAEGPVIDTSCAALLLLARKVHQHGYKVALTGEGADEWLAGYPWYKVHRLLGLLDAIPGLPLSQLARRAYLRLTGAPRVPVGRSARRIEQARRRAQCLAQHLRPVRHRPRLRFFSAEMWEQLGDHVPYADLRLNLERARRWHPLNRSLYLGARVMLPGLLLASKGDRVAMNSSVETRYPFLDEDVFDFLAKLHPRWKMRGLRDKLILRYARRALGAARRSPGGARRCSGRRWTASTRTKLPTFVDQLLSPESLRKTGYFDAEAVTHWRHGVQQMRPGGNQRTMVEMGLVGVVATQLWHHTYIDGSLADLPAWAIGNGGFVV